jgi:hypothetical protein
MEGGDGGNRTKPKVLPRLAGPLPSEFGGFAFAAPLDLLQS